MKKHLFKGVVWIGMLLVLSSSLFAAETGNLKVLVKDADGLPLPGVTVSVTSPSMMGSKIEVSTDTGMAHFARMTPGLYVVQGELEGFGTVKLTEVRVSLETTNTIEMTLRPAVDQSLIVTSDYPVVDTGTPMVAQHIQLEAVESLPIGRDYVAYMQLVNGVNMVPNAQGVDTPVDPAGKGGLNYQDRQVDGIRAGSRDNIYYMDGVNITGLATQTALLNFNNEVIQEQEIISSGVPAEYAGGKGIVANIVTKAGGNKMSGSVNAYFQSKDLVSDFTTEDTRLHTAVDNKFDTAFTIGGAARKDKVWYFGSGQRVSFTNDIALSDTASPVAMTVPYDQKRTNMFGKVTAAPTGNDQLVATAFWGDLDIEGTRDPNVLPDRRSISERVGKVFSVYYQRMFSADTIFDFRYGRYTRTSTDDPINLDAGVQNNVLFADSGVPAYERQFGGAATLRDDGNKRDYFYASGEKFAGDHHVKTGFTWTLEQDSDSQFYNNGSVLTSLEFGLQGRTLREITDLGLYDPSEVEARIVPALNANFGTTSRALDTNHDGVVSNAEAYAARFTSSNEHGLNFRRITDSKVGVNNVKAQRWSFYLQDDWKLFPRVTVNAGFRLQNNNYIDSNGESIVHIDTAFLTRLGTAIDMKGDGTRKLSFFYGEYLDDIPMGMVHFAGNRSGRVREEQIWLNNDWYTFRVRGSAETLDSLFTPGVKDPRAYELNTTFMNDFGDGLYLSAQAYMRKDSKLLEDYDFPLYFDIITHDPNFAHLALDPVRDFGYFNASSVPANVNYYQSNLVGAKRKYAGIDIDMRKRFKAGHIAAFQYSFKRARSNSQSDGNADLQGDLYEIDPRNPWMWGTMPGNIAHKVKVFGTYKTDFGLDVSGLFYWNQGWAYTESYIFGPGSYNIYINQPLNSSWTNFAQTGALKNPAWAQLDLKLAYKWKFSDFASAQLFLDIYNVTDNQAFIEEAAGSNDPEFEFREPTDQLNPRRFYMGARVNF